MAKLKSPIPIPFTKDGRLISYTSVPVGEINRGWDGSGPAVWLPNFVFTDVLKFKEFERGRSAAHAIFVSEDGKEYPMFLTDLHDAIGVMIRGYITGKFTFTKRGQNYALKAVMEDQ